MSKYIKTTINNLIVLLDWTVVFVVDKQGIMRQRNTQIVVELFNTANS